MDASNERYFVLFLAVVAFAVIGLRLARVPRMWMVLLIAFTFQGSAMFVVEHIDGFWLPLWLDATIGAATWGICGALGPRP